MSVVEVARDSLGELTATPAGIPDNGFAVNVKTRLPVIPRLEEFYRPRAA
jgi:hypothetical protein